MIDESTGLTGTHSELSALSKDHVHIFTMSMWDIQRKFRYTGREKGGFGHAKLAHFQKRAFPSTLNYHPCNRVRVVGLDNLRTVDADIVYIEAGIYHGGELLVADKCTREIPVVTYPRWNQWLIFDIAVKNVPKVCV